MRVPWNDKLYYNSTNHPHPHHFHQRTAEFPPLMPFRTIRGTSWCSLLRTQPHIHILVIIMTIITIVRTIISLIIGMIVGRIMINIISFLLLDLFQLLSEKKCCRAKKRQRISSRHKILDSEQSFPDSYFNKTALIFIIFRSQRLQKKWETWRKKIVKELSQILSRIHMLKDPRLNHLAPSPVPRPSQLAELFRSEIDPELFSHSVYIKFFATFATKVPYLTFCNKMKLIERDKIKRKWENVESESLSISSYSLHFISISSFSLHFLFIFSFSLHFLAACHKLCNPACIPI